MSVQEDELLSVLIPVYNAGPPLRCAIESILSQTHRNFELLLINDASKDRSADIIRSYERKDSRIRAIYHDKNVGLAATLNEGLHLARGALVVRMDQDDESLPHRLEVQRDFMHTNPEVVVSGSLVYHMGAKKGSDHLIVVPCSIDEVTRTLPIHNCIYHPSVILRRQPILDLGGYREQFKNAEDYDLWLRVSTKHAITNIGCPLLRYRFSVNGMTISRKWEQLFYVYLAQLSFQQPHLSIDLLYQLVQKRMEQESRIQYLRMVYDGAVSELLSLDMRGDALRLAWRSRKETGKTFMMKLLKMIASKRAYPI